MGQPEDEGMTRNLRNICGTGRLFEGMDRESKLRSVTMGRLGGSVTFKFQDGYKAEFAVEGDCCSRSWIEHLEVPKDINGATLFSIEDSPMPEQGGAEMKFYKTTFNTDRGAVVLEYRNESNGYYGGYLVRILRDRYKKGVREVRYS